jgi:hypothetical protein
MKTQIKKITILTLLSGVLLTLATNNYAQIGSVDKDLVYTPVTPCRLFDTRPSQGGTGPIAAAGTKSFAIWGQTTYAAQGGAASNCGITAGSDVAAVAMNVTVVTPAAGGFITAYPSGAARPTAATVNFQVGDIARGNFTIAKVAQSGVNNLSIFSSSSADVIGDVVGYYSKPMATALECYSTEDENFVVPIGFDGVYTTATRCDAGYSAVSANCFTSLTNMYFEGSGTTGNAAWCAWNNLSPISNNTVSQSVKCCQIPGR